jgi:hypothetical protein
MVDRDRKWSPENVPVVGLEVGNPEDVSVVVSHKSRHAPLPMPCKSRNTGRGILIAGQDYRNIYTMQHVVRLSILSTLICC